MLNPYKTLFIYVKYNRFHHSQTMRLKKKSYIILEFFSCRKYEISQLRLRYYIWFDPTKRTDRYNIGTRHFFFPYRVVLLKTDLSCTKPFKCYAHIRRHTTCVYKVYIAYHNIIRSKHNIKTRLVRNVNAIYYNILCITNAPAFECRGVPKRSSRAPPYT